MNPVRFDTPTEIMPLSSDAVEIARVLDERYRQGWELFHILDPHTADKIPNGATPHPPDSVVYVFRRTNTLKANLKDFF